MKVTPKTATGTNRISALKRLSKPKPINNNIHHRLSLPTTPIVTDARQLLTNPIVTDARQLLTNRNKPIFDARQLLSRQSLKSPDTSLTLRNDTVEIEEEEEEDDDNGQKTFFITRSKDGRLTSGIPDRSSANKKNTFANTRNSNSTEPISFTKTITNTSIHREDDDRYSQTSHTQSSSSDQKVVIRFVNDQYRKRPKSPSPTSSSPPPPVVRRLHNASIQTTHSSRSPIRTNSHRQYPDDHDEPPPKRNSSRNTISDREQQVLHSAPKASLKRTSTGASVSTRPKQTSSEQSNSDAATVLITNLQSTVTEDDVIELFGEVGHITEIKTLSRGCIQIVYSNPEHAEQAVAKYHNRLLDGKFMYVSIQQPASYSTKSSRNSSSQHSKSTTGKDNKYNSSLSSNNNNNESLHSNKITIDPTFIRQALFNPSNSTASPVQFQVKL